jgi:hypothetical protein
MLTVADIDPHIEREFGEPLERSGFRLLKKRQWVRSQKLPIREFFVLQALKGGGYSPAWGFSCGIVPSVKGQTFKRQSTDKNAVMDLIIDPIDTTGVPANIFSFITGADWEIPQEGIRACAEHFVPVAVADFDRVSSIDDFCEFFLYRSRLEYRRFLFHMYIQHRLAHGFVLILMGRPEEGRHRIEGFCREMEMGFDDPVLSDCIHRAERFHTTI